MIFFMSDQEKCDLLIQVTAWAGLIVYFKLHQPNYNVVHN